jgi:hypothetical protein
MITRELRGRAGTTFSDDSTDSAQDLSSISFKNADGDLLTGLFITCETNDVKYCYNADPVSAGLGHVLAVGGTAGVIIIVYQVDAATDEATLYEWEAANSGGVDIPYVVAGATGFWVAVTGKYGSGLTHFAIIAVLGTL